MQKAEVFCGGRLVGNNDAARVGIGGADAACGKDEAISEIDLLHDKVTGKSCSVRALAVGDEKGSCAEIKTLALFADKVSHFCDGTVD